MAVRNPTVWIPPSGEGYDSTSSNSAITTQSNVILTTQSNIKLQIQPGLYKPKNTTSWTLSTKNDTSWTPRSGAGYVETIGNELFVTNSGNFIVTNSGNNIVTNPTYNIPKYATQWTASGA